MTRASSYWKDAHERPEDLARPTLLFYCQHSLGLGHLVRSLALADGLAEYFDVVLLNGGRLPPRTKVPRGVELINLPPLGHDDGYELVSHDEAFTVEEAKSARQALVLDALASRRPAALLIELFPFGRKKFAFEIDPLLDAVAALGPNRPKVVCSVRDILVNQRRDQARHDERASLAANRSFDAVLVHTDPAFAQLGDSFRPETPLAVPVLYTGFVTSGSAVQRSPAPLARVIVSAGGGMVGEPLLRAAVGAHLEVVAADRVYDDAHRRALPARAGMAMDCQRGITVSPARGDSPGRRSRRRDRPVSRVGQPVRVQHHHGPAAGGNPGGCGALRRGQRG